MSVSGARAAVDIDLDDFERRLRAAGRAVRRARIR